MAPVHCGAWDWPVTAVLPCWSRPPATRLGDSYSPRETQGRWYCCCPHVTDGGNRGTERSSALTKVAQRGSDAPELQPQTSSCCLCQGPTVPTTWHISFFSGESCETSNRPSRIRITKLVEVLRKLLCGAQCFHFLNQGPERGAWLVWGCTAEGLETRTLRLEGSLHRGFGGFLSHSNDGDDDDDNDEKTPFT